MIKKPAVVFVFLLMLLTGKVYSGHFSGAYIKEVCQLMLKGANSTGYMVL